MAGASSITGGVIGTLIGLVAGWWLSSNFLAGPAAQITSSISGAAGGIMSHIPHGQGGYGDEY